VTVAHRTGRHCYLIPAKLPPARQSGGAVVYLKQKAPAYSAGALPR